MGMGWGEWVVQAHAREWEWRRVRKRCDDVYVVVAADWGWRRVGVEARARARTRLRRGDGVAVFVIDEGVGPWGCPVGAPG